MDTGAGIDTFRVYLSRMEEDTGEASWEAEESDSQELCPLLNELGILF